MLVAAQPAIAEDGLFHLGPGDVVEISVWKDESLTRNLVIPPDRVLSYPLVGEIDVTGMTVTDLRRKVSEKIYEYVPDATVTVIIKEINSLRGYVIGKVNNPGSFPITMDTTVMQILAMAEGLDPFASAGKIHILRKKKNVTVKIPFHYNKIIKGENLDQNITLQTGDVVVVP
jgi:polysaccharide export outer membrane protein